MSIFIFQNSIEYVYECIHLINCLLSAENNHARTYVCACASVCAGACYFIASFAVFRLQKKNKKNAVHKKTKRTKAGQNKDEDASPNVEIGRVHKFTQPNTLSTL